MNISRSNLTGSVDRETIKAITKLCLAAVSLIAVLYLVTLLPGIDRIVPQTPVTFVAIVGAIATVVLVGLLVHLAPKLALLVTLSLDGPKEVIEHAASVMYWLVLLVAVLVAHRGFAGVITPFLNGATWIYDAIFLVIALPLVIVIGARLFANLEPSSAYLAEVFVGTEEDARDTSQTTESTPE